MSKLNKKYLFVTGLLYPAVLGAFVYSVGHMIIKVVWENEASCYTHFGWQNAILVALLIGHYIGDYVYTLCASPEKSYSKTRMTFDILIVLSMFCGVAVVLDLEIGLRVIRIVVCSLFATKLFSLIWELRPGPPPASKIDRSAVILDCAFVALYVAVAAIHETQVWGFWALVGVLMLDLAGFVFFCSIDRLFVKLKFVAPMEREECD